MSKRAKMPWQRQYGQEEIAAELNLTVDRPTPREAKSQKAQLESCHQHGTRKDKKLKYHKKIT